MLNNQKCLHISLVVMPSYEEFEDTKGVTRIRKSKNDRQHNGHKLKKKYHTVGAITKSNIKIVERGNIVTFTKKIRNILTKSIFYA